MGKTLVYAKHAPGPARNGHDGCHARLGHEGMCPGVSVAAWLNGLGDDDEQFGLRPSHSRRHTTNGSVRADYIEHHDHILPCDERRAALMAEKQLLHERLAHLNEELARIDTAEGVEAEEE